jgi:hypothetical protein
MKDEKFLGDRQKALEDSFFRNLESKKIEKLRAAAKKEENIDALQKVCGIDDHETLATLVKMGMSAETVAALTLTPLVEVAWADGKLDDNERKAILQAASQNGLEKDSPAFSLLENWLDNKPEANLFDSWSAYITALAASMSESEANGLKQSVAAKAKLVAEAAGGFLGMGNKISSEEQAMLNRIKNLF